jgi:hypothetical protein
VRAVKVPGPGSPKASLFTPDAGLELVEVNFTTNTATVVATYYLTALMDPAGLTTTNEIVLFKITDTIFGCIFADNGIANPNNTTNGVAKIVVFNDAGSSITVRMSPEVMFDITASANNNGDITANIGSLYGGYFTTSRIAFVGVESRRNNEDSGSLCSTKLNATYTAVETQGPLALFSSTNLGRLDAPRWLPIDDDRYIFFADEWGNEPSYGDFPYLMNITEVNTTDLTYTIGDFVSPYPVGSTPFLFGSPLRKLRGSGSPFTNTPKVGSPNEGLGSPEPFLDYELDTDWAYVIDGTTLYFHTSLDDNSRRKNSGTSRVNTSPFQGTFDLASNSDRFVNTARELSGSAYPDRTTNPTTGVFDNTKVVAMDTGLMWRLFNPTAPDTGSPLPSTLGSPWVVPSSSGTRQWGLMNYNSSTVFGEGSIILTIDLDLATRTPLTTNLDVLSWDNWPKWESDGQGGAQPTAIGGVSQGADGYAICKLPNGKIVGFWGESQNRIDPAAPFFTEADYDARETDFNNDGPTTIYRGADFMAFYWDPTLTTGSPFIYPG